MDKVFDAILSTAGKNNVFALLFLLACCVAAYLFRELRKDHAAHQGELKEERDRCDALANERYSEAKVMTAALERSAQANIALEKSADERAVAIRDLTSVISLLVQKVDGLDRSVDVIRDHVSRLQGAPR